MQLAVAYRAVDVLMQSMTFRFTSVQLAVAHGAVGVLMSACSCSR
jgi:hypothetical protein